MNHGWLNHQIILVKTRWWCVRQWLLDDSRMVSDHWWSSLLLVDGQVITTINSYLARCCGMVRLSTSTSWRCHPCGRPAPPMNYHWPSFGHETWSIWHVVHGHSSVDWIDCSNLVRHGISVAVRHNNLTSLVNIITCIYCIYCKHNNLIVLVI